MVYEIHDPNNYIVPDGIADFTSVKLEEIGPNQVKITGGRGKLRPETLKVAMGYEDGFITENIIYVGWPNAWEKAQRTAEVAKRRAKDVYKIDAEEMIIDFIGVNGLAGPASPPPDPDINEIGVRIAAKTKTASEAAKVRSLGGDLTMGISCPGASFHMPLGTRPVVALWPALVPREEVKTHLSILEVD